MTVTSSPRDHPDTHPRRRRTGATGPQVAPAGDTVLVEEDLLVEDVSIDGMCGVY